MTISRRRVLAGALSAPAIVASTRLGSAAPAQTLKISHQFPGGTIDEGDFRDRLCRKFGAELEKRTNGALAAQVYPNSSLMKTVAQFSAVRKGVLDLSLYPISYGGGEFAELNIGLMPGLVSSYKQGGAWKQAQVGQKFSQFLGSKGVIIVSWIWQAGGVASRATPIVNPPDAKGLKVRGGSREMDMVLQAAGATTLSTPSNELYAAMQTGACDAAITSSDLVPAGGGRQKPHHRPRQVLLVHAGAAYHVEADLRRAVEEPAGRDYGARRRNGKVRHRGGHGRRSESRRRLCQEGRQGVRSRRGDR